MKPLFLDLAICENRVVMVSRSKTYIMRPSSLFLQPARSCVGKSFGIWTWTMLERWNNIVMHIIQTPRMFLLFLCLAMGSVGLVVHDEVLHQVASRLPTAPKFVFRELFEIQIALAQDLWLNISPNPILLYLELRVIQRGWWGRGHVRTPLRFYH